MATNKTRDNAHIRCIPTHVFNETLLLELCRDASCLCIIPTSLVCVLFGPAIPTYSSTEAPSDLMWRLCKVLSLTNTTVNVLSRATGHKQVKLQALLLNFINFINSLEEREKRRRKRPQRGADANYLPITDISTLCLNGRNVMDHVCPYMYWFTKRKLYTH